MDERSGRGWSLCRRIAPDERGFTLIELLVVVVIIGVLAAIAIPAYVDQQGAARDTAAQAQLRTAATAQQLHYADPDKNVYAGTAAALFDYGFRQGEQRVDVKSANDTSYCMEARGGGSNTFRISQNTGVPEPGSC